MLAGSAGGQHQGLHAEVLLAQVGDGLGDAGMVVENVLRPGAHRNHLVAFSRLAVIRLGRASMLTTSPFSFMHLGGADVVARHDQAAVL
jgi:hypothetical protein